METKKVPLTRQAYERLKSELDYLQSEGRLKMSEEIGAARAHGDISENAEYHSAKEAQGLQEARIRQLQEMIENAEIIKADDESTVKPGKLVTILHEGDDEPETYMLGLREEKGGEYDVLTPDSPLGKALIGHSAGETVLATVPAGELRVEIVEVRAAQQPGS